MEIKGIGKVGIPEERFTFNAQSEKQKELNGGNGYFYETDYRGYDPQLGRFMQYEPLAALLSSISPYQFAFNNPIKSNDPTGLCPDGEDCEQAAEGGGGGDSGSSTDDGSSNNSSSGVKKLESEGVKTKKLQISDPDIQKVETSSSGDGNNKKVNRLILWGGASGSGDNDAFNAASKNLKNEYEKSSISRVGRYEITNGGQSIIENVNRQPRNSLQSLDVFSHGGPEAFYFDESGGNKNLYISPDSRSPHHIGKIDYKKFTYWAKIEIHGCRACDSDSRESYERIARGKHMGKELSKRLYNAGNHQAVVICHPVKGNPNINGTDDRNEQDYRHGLRLVYHNGTLLFRTRRQYRITAAMINEKLKEKFRKSGKEFIPFDINKTGSN